ncbi:MAG: SMP-30/gluconolactonase/LRE family protein [Steroidobacteraceae bacterium]
MHAEHAFSLGAELGEGPLWVETDAALWMVDIKGRRLHRLRPGRAEHEHWTAPAPPGFLAARAAGGFVVGLQGGLHLFDPASGRFTLLSAVEAQNPENRINDGCVSPEGALWFGSMHDPEHTPSGVLYRLGADGLCVPLDRGYVVTNGPAFSPDGRTFYHTDSPGRTVYAFNRPEPHVLTNKRVLVQIEPGDGYPDGTTVDAEGCLWVALWSGWAVRRYSPDGRLLATVRLPCAQVTKVAFGGADLRTGYVTTARQGLSPTERAAQTMAGDVFCFNAPVAGLAQPLARVGCA